MKACLVRPKASGQSLPLIALMIVVLVAMVGLAVDVGNTYAEQRNTVRSSNAAALAGMTTLINGSDDTTVYNAIVASLASNNIKVAASGAQPADGERTLIANYLDASGNPLVSCPNVGSCGSTTPQGVTYIRVVVNGQVDTYFARLVNTNTLPVGANAWASKGACTTGIYPITIRDNYLGQNGFVSPDSLYTDSTYKGKTMKRVQIKDSTNPNGGFGWLRWKSGSQNGDATELEAMLTGSGNIAEAFNEPNWPSANTLNLPKQAGYPQVPTQLNPGDWVYGNSGVSNSTAVRAQLDLHIKNRTVMILPIHDAEAGSGVDGIYHVSRLGAFLLRGYELNGQGYLDLVYLGNASECPLLVTPPARNTNVGIAGQAFFRPRNRLVPQSRPPVEYEIILDVSGSMSWKFDGYGYKNGNAVLCTGTTASCSGSAYAWPDQTLRRIYVAKQAIKSFIDSMQTNDTMRIVQFTGELSGSYGNQNAVNNLTKAWPVVSAASPLGWSSDKTILKAAVDSAGASGGTYLTDGRTPSAVGLAGGNQVLSSAPTKAADGQEYKRVVIFLTDGVANIYRNGQAASYGSGCGSEIASCNVGYTSGNPAVAKPITAMILESDNIKQTADTVYVIALAGVDETGLKSVASAPNYPYFSSSKNGTDLQGIFDNIATNVKYSDCVPSGGNKWERSMAEADLGDLSASQGGPLTYPVVGKAYLYDQNGNQLPNGKGVTQLQIDPQSGNITYHFDDLTPGTYQLRGFVSYRGDDDISRVYNQIYNPNTAVIDSSVSIQVDPSGALGTVLPVPPLYLDMSGSVCPSS